jgi:hypothetical protein
MGWRRGRFPVLSQLNTLTTKGSIEDTKVFFTAKYGADGAGYELGSLCMDWREEDPVAGIPGPPWEDDEDNRWNREDASDWRAHCLVDLDAPNPGGADGVTPSGNTVKADLEAWITDAILGEKAIKYRYKPVPGSATWRADLTTISGKRVRVVVSGPGF